MLKRIFDEVRVVDVLDSGDTAHLAMMKRPDLGVTFTKLHCWTLTHYSKCVFMDADTLVRLIEHLSLRNIQDVYYDYEHVCLCLFCVRILGAFKYRRAV